MDNSNTKKYVEGIATYFDDKKEDNERLFYTYNRILKFLNCNQISKGNKVLDLGSGDGSFVNVCKEKSVDAIPLDAYSQNIDFEKDRLPFDNEIFDFITLTSLIEHINNPKLILGEINRILKKDGFVIITTPNFKYCYEIFYDDPTHVKPYTKKSIERVLHMNEFKVLKTLPFLVNKSDLFWKLPYSFKIASLIPFKNHQFRNNFLIPNFLKGKSTAMTIVAKKKNKF